MTVLDLGIERGACITGVGHLADRPPDRHRRDRPDRCRRAGGDRRCRAAAGGHRRDRHRWATRRSARPPGPSASTRPGAAAGSTPAGCSRPVMSAFVAVGTGQARHVLVYRTVQMMGGSILPAAGRHRRTRRARGAGFASPRARLAEPAADDARLLGRQLARHALPAAHVPVRHDQGAARLAGGQQPPQRRPQSRRRVPRSDHARRLPRARPISTRSACSTATCRSTARSPSWSPQPTTPADCPNPPSGSRRSAGPPARAAGTSGPTTRRWPRSTRPPQMWSRTDLTPADVDVAELYDGFTFLTFAWLEALGLCGEGEAGPFVEGGERASRSTASCRSTPTAASSRPAACTATGCSTKPCLQLRGAGGRPAGTRRRGRRRVKRRRPDRRLHAPCIVMPGQRRNRQSERVRG